METFLLIPFELLLLLGLSAVCSGLNIALMSLEISDLRRKAELGNHDAKRVLPLRKNAHLSLAAILFTNIGAVSALSIILDHQINGVVAGIASTLLIVVLGEILPQAYFSKRALKISARLAPLLRAMITITFIVAKPLQLLLDKLFGKGENTKLQSREELGLLISEHASHDESELDDDEVGIMRGALMLSEKHVGDIMTPLKDVYYLLPSMLVDGQKIDEIKAQGRSRIPVINKQRTICFGLLLMKDLVDMDFDDEAVYVHDLPLHPPEVVGSRTALDTLLRIFIKSGTHLAPVERNDKIVGVVTVEDLMEEIVGREIEDESDRKRQTSDRRRVTSLDT